MRPPLQLGVPTSLALVSPVRVPLSTGPEPRVTGLWSVVLSWEGLAAALRVRGMMCVSAVGE